MGSDYNVNDKSFLEFEDAYNKNLIFLNDVGLVLSCADGIVKVSGLLNVAYGEMVYFCVGELKIIGLVLNLEADSVSVVVLDKDTEIKPVI
jgi:F0F1-type ATP synthase alpha subunit